MPDAISELERVVKDIAQLSAAVDSTKGKWIQPATVQPLTIVAARRYFEGVRPDLLLAQNRQGLCEEIDYVMQQLLALGASRREKAAYSGQIAEVQPYLTEAMVDLLRARSNPILLLSPLERSVLQTLQRMLPTSALSYEQCLRDMIRTDRVSWRGTASELREVLREVIDHLAPDDQVTAQTGFQLDTGQRKPTQKQKVRFILRARRVGTAAVDVAQTSLATVDESVASLARSTYTRGAASTHSASSRGEARNLKRYVDALLAELLEIA